MSRKRQTQVELERDNADLRRQIQQLQRRLKQTLRQLRNHEDISYDVQATLDLEQESTFQDMLAGNKPEEPSDILVFTLADGSTKTIRKRVANE